MKMFLPRFALIRPLIPKDLDSTVSLEEAAFKPNERASREKINYRLNVCPELCIGLFVRSPDDILPSQYYHWSESSIDDSSDLSNNNSPKNNKKNSSFHDGNDDENDNENSILNIKDEKYPIKTPYPLKVDQSEQLVAHILATRISSDVVTDQSMEIPELDQYYRRVPGDLRGHDFTGNNIAIHSVAVHPDYQGRQIATLLLKDYIQRLAGQNVGEKLVIIAHPDLAPFYKRFGFEDLGESSCKFAGETWHDLSCHLEDAKASLL